MNVITFKRQRGNVRCLWTEDDHSQVIGTPDILQIPYNITLYITCRKLSTNYTTVVVRGLEQVSLYNARNSWLRPVVRHAHSPSVVSI